jgi:CRP-like cAMP-binding protein
LIETIPQFSRNICSILSSQLNELQERYHEISAERVERRVACALIRLDRQFGNPSGGGSEIAISRQELAQMTGTTLFTVSRLISKWGELGLVSPRREAVLMLDAKRLDRLSGLETDL